LFLDVEMPNGGGFELLARLKPPHRWCSLPPTANMQRGLLMWMR
jgi:CheY-like chemotaxis protein